LSELRRNALVTDVRGEQERRTVVTENGRRIKTISSRRRDAGLDGCLIQRSFGRTGGVF